MKKVKVNKIHLIYFTKLAYKCAKALLELQCWSLPQRARGRNTTCTGHQYNAGHTHHSLTHKSNAVSPISLMCTSLDCGKKKYPEKNPCRHGEDMQIPHRKAPRWIPDRHILAERQQCLKLHLTEFYLQTKSAFSHSFCCFPLLFLFRGSVDHVMS